MKELQKLLAKVEEMKNQRAMLEDQFRTKLREDDITNVLVTQETNKQVCIKVSRLKRKKNDVLSNAFFLSIVMSVMYKAWRALKIEGYVKR